MGSKRRKNARRQGGHRFVGVPHVVLDSESYKQLPNRAKALMMDIAYFYNGRNNGDLSTAWGIMKRRGWRSKSTLSAAVNDLLSANLILKTRDGRFQNPGSCCDLYALTWRPIDECRGKNLDVPPTATPPRKFSLESFNSPSPYSGLASNHKSGRHRDRDGRGRYVSNLRPGRDKGLT